MNGTPLLLIRPRSDRRAEEEPTTKVICPTKCIPRAEQLSSSTSDIDWVKGHDRMVSLMDGAMLPYCLNGTFRVKTADKESGAGSNGPRTNDREGTEAQLQRARSLSDCIVRGSAPVGHSLIYFGLTHLIRQLYDLWRHADHPTDGRTSSMGPDQPAFLPSPNSDLAPRERTD